MGNQNHWIYDFETLANCTIGVFEHYQDPDNIRVFEMSPFRNDTEELLVFLENSSQCGEYHIGFNNLGFDGQIEQALLKGKEKLRGKNGVEVAGMIYRKAQSVINDQDYGENRFSGTPEWKMLIKQIDLYKIWHFDNPQRRCSLKWLQFTCDWYSVLEMPIHHSTYLKTQAEVQQVIEYCKNDVKFTKFFYTKTKPLLQVRKDIKQKYKIDCLNYSNTKIGSELLLKMYCKKTGKRRPDVKKLNTKRESVNIGEVIFPYITFQTEEFNRILNQYKNTVIVQAKGEVALSTIFRGCKFDYGMGGIHGCIPGMYKADELYDILDIDVGSQYPNIACENGMYPAHLGPEFYKVYKNDIVDVRMAEKAKGKDGDQAIISGFKEAANATFGNSNQKHSWLLDLQYLVQTTVNGQLLISMIVERLLLEVEGIELIQVNTDGATFRVLKSEREKFDKICQEWEVLTRLKLEYAQIQSIFIPNVNAYLVTYVGSDKIKAKNRFEYENLEPHKNKSFLVIPKGVKEYLVNGVIPEDYVKSNRNIYDYCGGSRATGEWLFMGVCYADGKLLEAPMQKVVRFYISTEGCKIMKVNTSDGRRISTVAGIWLQQDFNLFLDKPWDDYKIDYRYYVEQIYKEIGALSTVKTNQLTFDF